MILGSGRRATAGPYRSRDHTIREPGEVFVPVSQISAAGSNDTQGDTSDTPSLQNL